jgi:TPR repeat protein
MKKVVFWAMIFLLIFSGCLNSKQAKIERQKFETEREAKMTADCDKGDMKNCLALGLMHFYEEGVVNPDNDKGERLLDKACSAGEKLGCLILGNHYTNYSNMDLCHRISRPIIKYSYKQSKKACKNGSAEDCNIVGYHSKNKKKSLDFFKRACDLGSNDGCYNTGFFYIDGEHVEYDLGKAVDYWEKHHWGKFTSDFDYECRIHLNGKADIIKAADYYKKACDVDYPLACYNYFNSVNDIKPND